MYENTLDKHLKIKTTGRDDSKSDQYRYPYEPTPYSVLERLVNSGFIRKKDVVLDYGCGYIPSNLKTARKFSVSGRVMWRDFYESIINRQYF